MQSLLKTLNAVVRDTYVILNQSIKTQLCISIRVTVDKDSTRDWPHPRSYIGKFDETGEDGGRYSWYIYKVGGVGAKSSLDINDTQQSSKHILQRPTSLRPSVGSSMVCRWFFFAH